MTSPLTICGFASDGRPVLAGLFQMADTHGIPLDIACAECERIGAVPSVPHFWASAIAAGWTEERTAARLDSELRVDGRPFDYASHRPALAALYLAADTLTGRALGSREIGAAMRQHIETDGGRALADTARQSAGEATTSGLS